MRDKEAAGGQGKEVAEEEGEGTARGLRSETAASHTLAVGKRRSAGLGIEIEG